MLKFRLTEDEKDVFTELVKSEGFILLLDKILPALIAARGDRVLTQSVNEQSDLLKLALVKAEFDGCKKLAADVANLNSKK